MATAAERQILWSMLSADEQQRAQRFVRQQDRHGFVVGRGTLRQLLGQYLEVAPVTLAFGYGDHGKPQLSSSDHSRDLRFNLSHSHGRVLYAFTLGMDVGVDLEQVNPHMDYEGITRRFFSSQEQQALFRLPVPQREGTFFQIWTRKEACIKAMGGSIAMALSQVEVAISLDQSTTVIEIPTANGQLVNWWVLDLRPEDGYRGALAIATPPQVIQAWQWSPDTALSSDTAL